MKLKSLLSIVCFGVFTSAFAGNVHTPHSTNSTNTNQKSVIKNSNASSGHPYCGIYIKNKTDGGIVVSGNVDDWYVVDPFVVDAYPQYINLDYDDYCHEWMQNIRVDVPPFVLNTRDIQAGKVLNIYLDYYNQPQFKITDY